jgi:hypothetical protein
MNAFENCAGKRNNSRTGGPEIEPRIRASAQSVQVQWGGRCFLDDIDEWNNTPKPYGPRSARSSERKATQTKYMVIYYLKSRA